FWWLVAPPFSTIGAVVIRQLHRHCTTRSPPCPYRVDGAALARPDVQRSAIARIAFPLLAWGLAFHSLVMAILFGPLRLPATTVRLIAAWKEIALVLLVLIVIFRAFTGHGPRVSVSWTDLWIGGLISTGLIYFVGASILLRT